MTTESATVPKSSSESTKLAKSVDGRKSNLRLLKLGALGFMVWVYFNFFKSLFAFREQAVLMNIKVRSSKDLFYIAILALVNLVSFEFLGQVRSLEGDIHATDLS